MVGQLFGTLPDEDGQRHDTGSRQHEEEHLGRVRKEGKGVRRQSKGEKGPQPASDTRASSR
jgi:hypothetical protein